MAKIVLWSPNAVSNGQTYAAIAISTLVAIEEDYSNILLHGHWQAKKIASSFESYDDLKARNVFNNSGMGITALTRLVESNKLTPESIRNYAKPILKQRLDIMYGTNVTSREQYNQMIAKFPSIVQKSSEAYDYVWIDLPKTFEKEYIKETLNISDLIIVTCDQDLIHLEEAIDFFKNDTLLKDKKKLFLICNYEEKSKYNIKNIRRKFGFGEPIYTLPHNVIFMDACNDGNVVETFFYKNLVADSTDYNGDMITKTREIAKEIIATLKI